MQQAPVPQATMQSPNQGQAGGQNREKIAQVGQQFRNVLQNVERVILGKTDVISRVLAAMCSGGHVLLTAPTHDRASPTSQNLYWRLRAACYLHVPGVVRFADPDSLVPLVEDQGLTVVRCEHRPGAVAVLARR